MTVPVTANVLLRGQLAYLRKRGFRVTVISSPGAELDAVASREGVDVVAVPMTREIDARSDAVSLMQLTRAIRRLRPDIVNASTAKGGLLGTVASRIARVPVRVYLLRGLRLETEIGAKRSILAATERVASGSAHRVICVSRSLQTAYVGGGFAPASKCTVLGAGSSNGVDVERFARARWLREAGTLRMSLAIPPKAPVIGFIGRLVADKGVRELMLAFRAIRAQRPDVHLLIVGAGFAGDVVDPEISSAMSDPNIRIVGHVDEPAPYYAIMDVLAFPSHREGLPNVPLEAGAASVPVVGSRATGVVDVISDGLSGRLVDLKDAHGLAVAVSEYLQDPALRATHGEFARQLVAREFSNEVVWHRWYDEYVRLLAAAGAPGLSSRRP